MLAVFLLLVCLGALGWFMRNDIADYAAFKLLTETVERQKRYRAWVVKSFSLFTGGTVLALAILGRLDALIALPREFAPLSQALRSALSISDFPFVGFLGGFVGAMVAGAAAATMIAKRKAATSKAAVVGDIEALMPRNGPETAHTAVMSINAGLSEEIFFRLLFPLLLTIVLGNAVYGFAGAAIVFGLIHFYQGWIGVVATTILGLVLTALYLWTGSLWIAIAAHALLDLMGLVVRPTLARLIAAR